MAGLCGRAIDRPELMDDKFFELAYGFCGLYADADRDDDASAESAWLHEAATHTTDNSPFDAPADAPEAAVEAPAESVNDDELQPSADLDLAEEVARDVLAVDADAPDAGPELESILHAVMPEESRLNAIADALQPLRGKRVVMRHHCREQIVLAAKIRI